MLYTCNTCSCIFDNKEEKPLSCPFCHASLATYRTDTGKKVSIQAVREATAEEVSAYTKILKETSEKKTFLERVKDLKEYELSVDEYNMALMLLFFYKTGPVFYTKQAIDQLLNVRKADSDQEASEEDNQKYYYMVRRHFTSSLTAERRIVGSNETTVVASYTEAGSAANILMLFRQDESKAAIRELFGEAPNLGDIRRVDYKTVARHPGDGYRKFLRDWHNSLQEDGENR